MFGAHESAASQESAASHESAASQGAGGEVKRMYLANDVHTDYMWEGTVEEYRTAFLNMLDYYMQQAEDTADNPPDARGKFNCDGSYWIWEYEQNKTQEEFDRLVGHLQAGTITTPLHTLVQLYGAMPTEAVLRSMYYAGRLERRYGLDINMVAAIENQSLPAGVASLWAGAGAKYSWKGVCGCATFVPYRPRPREIYHFAGPDGQSVCMKWNTLIDDNRSIGGYAEARYPDQVVPRMDSDPAFTDNWPWPVSGAFGMGWDNLEFYSDAHINAALNLSNSSRRVIVSDKEDFFEDFLANHGDEIETFSGSFGNDWDLLTASLAEVTAEFRRKVEKLRTAEALAAAVSLYAPTFMDGREMVRDEAFHACGLYYEHDWTANGDVSKDDREQWQRDLLTDLSEYVDPLQDDALAALGSMIPNPGGAERHAVFNALSWLRTDVVDLPVEMAGPVHIVDILSGAEVPSQEVEIDGTTYVRILARNVPAVGYKVFEVRAGEGNSFPDAAAATGSTLSNDRYTVSMGARGQITSLQETGVGIEWVESALHDLGIGNGAPFVENSGPVSVTFLVDAGGAPNHESRVTLLHPEIDRVEVEGRITDGFSSTKYYDYDFDISNFTVRHEEVGMVATAARKAQGGDYADENARLDHLTFNHFVDFSNDTRGVTLSNWDCSFFKLGDSGYQFLDTSTPGIRALVGGQLDSGGLGIRDQGGDQFFRNRFALRTHDGYDQAEAMRFSLEHQNPLVAARVTADGPLYLDPDLHGFLQGLEEDVLLWSLKPSEEGVENGGIIARYWNLSDQPTTHLVSLPLDMRIAQAKLTTHIETDIADLWVFIGVAAIPMNGHQMQTIRIIPEFLASDVDGPVVTTDPQPQLFVYPQPVAVGQRAKLSFALPSDGPVRVDIFDVGGRKVATLADEWMAAGSYDLAWPSRGEERPSVGVYLARLAFGRSAATSKIVLVD